MVDRVRRREPPTSARTSARRRWDRAWHAVLRPERFWVGAVLALALVPAALGCGRGPDQAPDQAAEPSAIPRRSVAPPHSRSSDPTPTPRVVSVVTAGDIACSPLDRDYDVGAGDETGCLQKATSDLIATLRPDAVIPLGDTQYQHGTYHNYLTSYAPTWGRFLDITHPVIGNHEYLAPRAAGYFAYFGRAAGDPRKAYYSFDLGRWHIVVLNTACQRIGGCAAGSPQQRWLVGDLATHRTRCTLAAWHEPRWSSGQHGSEPALQTLWKDLHAGGVDVVVGGYDHDYERFHPLDAEGNRDSRGVRSFVVGTGGVGLRGFFGTIARGSAVRQDTTFGVLHLTLRPDGYDWRFVPVGDRFHDSGNGTCH
ncbi:MAG: Alkaline phosphatase [Marmoricola sp.]|nr:Alkaline phosphatase [Marmoricola sp.]